MNKKLLISLIIIIVIVLILGFWIWKRQGVIMTTNKKEYQKEEVLKVNIKNNLLKNVCFSSCYPYYLEKKNGEWQVYDYGKCETPDLTVSCIKPVKGIKGFELTLIKTREGLHRLAVPVCIGCKVGEKFKEDKRFYSNEFLIK